MKARAASGKRPTVRERFRLQPFTNPSGETVWRVAGTQRDGTRIRENYPSQGEAIGRKQELEIEAANLKTEIAARVKPTRLSDGQIKVAEAAFERLPSAEELGRAVDYWLRHGKAASEVQSPALADAFAAFDTWLSETPSLRDRTKHNLRLRVAPFAARLASSRVHEVTPEGIMDYLKSRKVSPVSRDNDLRAISRFFSWCSELPRKWVAVNPASLATVELPSDDVKPDVLTVDECTRLLRAAESLHGGALLPYTVATMFAGLRPSEAARLTWQNVNLHDGEIRLEAAHTKTGKGRVVEFNDGGKEQAPFNDALNRWLSACEGRPFFPSNWRRMFDDVKRAAGFGGRGDTKLKPWTEDVLRHTSISHFVRLTGSYGRTADQFGNSEAIIVEHYKARVSSADTARFYSVMPGASGTKDARPANVVPLAVAA